jgi:hypothetical protein
VTTTPAAIALTFSPCNHIWIARRVLCALVCFSQTVFSVSTLSQRRCVFQCMCVLFHRRCELVVGARVLAHATLPPLSSRSSSSPLHHFVHSGSRFTGTTDTQKSGSGKRATRRLRRAILTTPTARVRARQPSHQPRRKKEGQRRDPTLSKLDWLRLRLERPRLGLRQRPHPKPPHPKLHDGSAQSGRLCTSTLSFDMRRCSPNGGIFVRRVDVG